MYSLMVEDLYKCYKGREVVKNVSLGLSEGECVGLLGPNGAGKTTSFYMISGLVKPDKGNVMLFGKDITNYPIYKRCEAGIGYLAQEPTVFRNMTVFDNIMTALELSKYNGDKNKRASDILDMFKLDRIKLSLGASLSGGERRRVEVARIIATDPKFILLDEPFAGIDPISVVDIQELIRGLVKMGIGVLITDHNVRETLGITSRAYILAEGMVLAEGTPEELVNNEDVKNKYLGRDFRV